MKRKNLNGFSTHHSYLHSPEANYSLAQKSNGVIVSEKATIETHFKNLDQVLVEKIRQSEAVVGCVAWLTHEGILNALAKTKHGVSIVIQKEDFLRPDINQSGVNFSLRMRELYDQLKPITNWGERSFRKKIDQSGFDSNSTNEWYMAAQEPVDISIRCVGYRKGINEFALPRMHHKFLVFCKVVDESGYPFTEYEKYRPYAVWTGSFNMTKNGTMSLENGVYIESDDISLSYYKEWINMLLLSEALDWESEWAAPDLHYLDECAIIS